MRLWAAIAVACLARTPGGSWKRVTAKLDGCGERWPCTFWHLRHDLAGLLDQRHVVLPGDQNLRTAVLIVTNGAPEVWAMLCNLLTGLRGSLLRRGFVIGALDTEAMDLCRIADWACFDLRGNVTGPQGADMQSAGKVAWVEFTWAKAWMTSAAMRLGYRVLAVDTDVGFVRDPVSHIQSV